MAMSADEPFALLDFMQITDRSFPTGSFVHSAGLEWLVKGSSVGLESVIRMRTDEQLAHFELPYLLAALDRPPAPLDARYHAMLMPREAREASVQVGRQLLANVSALFPDRTDVGSLPHGHHPIAFGVVARTIGIPPREAALAYAFQVVRGQVSAAQRLTRLGQSEAQRLIHRSKPWIEAAVATARAWPIENAVAFAPLLDIASMTHERSDVRLFVS